MDEKNRLETAFRCVVQQREDLVVKKENMSASWWHLFSIFGPNIKILTHVL